MAPSSLGEPSASRVNDTYWRMDDFSNSTKDLLEAFLKRHGFYFKSSSSKQRLRELQTRAYRHLLSYDKYPVAELRGFARVRHLHPLSDSKADVIRCLENADETTDLSRIMDLPPEMRAIIFEHYMKALGTIPHMATQPPLCKVSRRLRDETLPLFYSTCPFHFTMSEVAIGYDRERGCLPNSEINSKTSPRLSSHLLPKIGLPRLRYIALELRSPRGRGEQRHQQGGVWWDIDLRDKVEMKYWFEPDSKEPPKWLDKVTRELQAVVDAIKARPGAYSFSREDFESLRVAVGRVLHDRWKRWN